MIEGIHADRPQRAIRLDRIPALPNRGRAVAHRVEPGRIVLVEQQPPGHVGPADGGQRRIQMADADEARAQVPTEALDVLHQVLDGKGPVGRRLDFLMQELNREANTLSSKSADADVTRIAVEMKVLIEQMREQVQNLE